MQRICIHMIFVPQWGADANKNTSDQKYSCIKNIVSDTDLFSKVAPEKLGFTRYGLDINLPAYGSEKEDEMLKELEKVSENLKKVMVSENSENYDNDKSLKSSLLPKAYNPKYFSEYKFTLDKSLTNFNIVKKEDGLSASEFEKLKLNQLCNTVESRSLSQNLFSAFDEELSLEKAENIIPFALSALFDDERNSLKTVVGFQNIEADSYLNSELSSLVTLSRNLQCIFSSHYAENVLAFVKADDDLDPGNLPKVNSNGKDTASIINPSAGSLTSIIIVSVFVLIAGGSLIYARRKDKNTRK